MQELNDLKGQDAVNQLGFDFIIVDCKFDEKLIKLVVKELFPNVNTFNYHWSKKENNIKSRIHLLKNLHESNNQDASTFIINIIKLNNEFL